MSEQNTAVQEREQQTAQKTVRFEILRQDTADSESVLGKIRSSTIDQI